VRNVPQKGSVINARTTITSTNQEKSVKSALTTKKNAIAKMTHVNSVPFVKTPTAMGQHFRLALNKHYKSSSNIKKHTKEKNHNQDSQTYIKTNFIKRKIS
jgi:hypothetical protein